VIANELRVKAAGADGTMQELVGTPFKLAGGGGMAATAAPSSLSDSGFSINNDGCSAAPARS
jgi:hypothetical protein